MYTHLYTSPLHFTPLHSTPLQSLGHYLLVFRQFPRLGEFPVPHLGHEQIVTPLEIEQTEHGMQRHGNGQYIPAGPLPGSPGQPHVPKLKPKPRIEQTADRYPRGIKQNGNELDLE